MMTPAEAEKTFISQLKSIYDAEEAKDLAFYTVHHLSGISKSHFLLNKNEQIAEVTPASLIRIIDELKAGKPFQYVLGETEFYGLHFKVDSSVLIPRLETEELVDWVLSEVRGRRSESRLQTSDFRPQTSDLTILDIGTGSGCIAVTLKKHLPDAKVYAIDKFKDALETAKHNAALNETEIFFIQTDILKDPDLIPDLKYSIIISNPPYITDEEKQHMHKNVLEHEPHSALFVADSSPLIFYDRIAELAKTRLIDGGQLFFEINESFGEQLANLLKNKGFSNIELRKDMQGKDRMIKADRNR